MNVPAPKKWCQPQSGSLSQWPWILTTAAMSEYNKAEGFSPYPLALCGSKPAPVAGSYPHPHPSSFTVLSASDPQVSSPPRPA